MELGGYLRSLTGVHDTGFDVSGADRRTGFNAEVVRIKWRGRWGDRVAFTVHQRLQARVSSTDQGIGEVVGFGVSAVPRRALDLESVLVDEDRLRVWHDVDRLAVSVYSGLADVTLGRQAITWGISTLFPVADLWAQFSPFELDTEEKPGIDAVRVLTYPAPGVELDAVVADRGRTEDLSAGIRVTVGLPWADVYAAAGKFWNEAIALGGVTGLRDQYRLRAEAALPWNLDGDSLDLPRVTVGVDRLSARVQLSAEYHLNGIGAGGSDGYAERFDDPRVARGETYFLGRHYLGGVVAWTADREERLVLSLSGLVNVRDPSAAFTPVLSYDFGQSTRASVGGLWSLGATPAVDELPALRTEYGAYGDLWYTRVSVYF